MVTQAADLQEADEAIAHATEALHKINGGLRLSMQNSLALANALDRAEELVVEVRELREKLAASPVVYITSEMGRPTRCVVEVGGVAIFDGRSLDASLTVGAAT